ncbi:hypothetical protein AB5J62_13155 [Amycolatopsis sp. cg5]|uniref:hypothetical protein n=1 Tax=Amycolatopsis sp. cg5 TaxID=3238802 RepID=UPI0035253243
MSRSARRAVVVSLALAVSACAAEPAPGPVTYDLGARPVRAGEQALKVSPARNGDTEFTLIGLTSAIPTITGSHAEFNAKGKFTRIRLVVTGTGLSTVLFDARRQQLVLDGGAVADPDQQAMTIKRQPDKFDLGPTVRVEFDLYYDIAKDAKPVALRAFGGPTLIDVKNLTGTDIKLA